MHGILPSISLILCPYIHTAGGRVVRSYIRSPKVHQTFLKLNHDLQIVGIVVNYQLNLHLNRSDTARMLRLDDGGLSSNMFLCLK